ncbi:GDSL esterase/lipase At2g30310 isoform X2 [Ziziphus jujuba]|uniref:GDSL esterase/lipase At2g30310 isoform X2 n=1 Tax=Ziziphus jujuba TaxID=326968 RepID=A0ABM3I9Y7_ZIZJJ|nr:GDSL esterase/lipase At2g30310 isoform X2 [Ziziphus jujuba]
MYIFLTLRQYKYTTYISLEAVKMFATSFFFILTIISKTCIIIASSTDTSSPKFPAILIFGDSTVDTGNNNYIKTLFKGNYYPYGKDFPGHVPTGRFSNGKLVPDFIASTLKIKDIVPPFLKPNLSDEELLTGVSFASAGSGYDDLTTVASGVIPVSKQIEYFKKYIERIQGIVGEKEAKNIVKRALVLISAGTNDLVINFYDTPTRRLEFDINGYQDFLQKNLKKYIEVLLPGSKLVYADIYDPLIDMIKHPQKYGFVETKRGCCGTGLVEAGPFCNSLTPPCNDASQYVFWDTVHPSEAAYQFLSIYLEKEVLPKLLYNNQSHSLIHSIGKMNAH